MKALQIINGIVSFVIMSASLWLLFKHYSDVNSKLEMKLKSWQYYFLKLGLVFMSMGTFFNLIKKEPTPESEILLNVGLAMFMVFLAMMFDAVFLDKDDVEKGHDTIDPTGEDLPDDQDE